MAVTEPSDEQVQDFANYANKILTTIEKGLDEGKLNEVQTLAIFIQLKTARTKEELDKRIKTLKEKYPILEDVVFKETVEVEEGIDDKVQLFVAHLIKDGRPTEAEQFAKDSDKDGTTLESLKADYPEFSTFLNEA